MSDACLTPPFRFALLAASIRPSDPPASLYRGSLPKHHNLAFLASLGLKTIVSVTPKPVDVYEADARAKLAEKELEEVRVAGEGGPRKRRRASDVNFMDWATREGIRVIHVKVGSGKPKDGHIPFDTATVKTVLELIVSRDNLPMYIHDLDGSDVLSIMGAALRKLQGWPEQAYTAEMSRFLRAPPPAPEHRTFLSRLFASTPHASDDGALFLHIPPPSIRAPWLWSSGVPTAPPKKPPNNPSPSTSADRDGPSHATMRCRIARDPDDAAGTGATGASATGASETVRNGEEQAQGRPEPARMESDGQRTLRGDSVGRTGSSTPQERDSRSRNSSLGGPPGDRGESRSPCERGRHEGTDQGNPEGEGEEEDDDEEEEGSDDDVPVSRMIDALDLGV